MASDGTGDPLRVEHFTYRCSVERFGAARPNEYGWVAIKNNRPFRPRPEN